MRYLRIEWLHSKPHLPVELFSELDDQNFEVRKVELFADGSFGFAGPEGAIGTTMLGVEPFPPLHEIAADAEFKLHQITKEEFDLIWDRAYRDASVAS